MRIIELMKEKQGVLIGMVHCLPLPGAMNHCGSMDAVVAKAVADAKKLEQAGFDAVLVEPTLDRPMGMTRGPLQLAAMSVICGAVHQVVSVPMGVSFMTADCGDLFAIARASGADFVRITAFVDTVRFPVGVVQPCAARVWEVRRNGGMEDIAVLADIQVKHAEMVFPQVTLEQSACYAQAQGADAIVVTGDSTGQETPLETIQRARRVSKIPVVAGSGVAVSNIKSQMEQAAGFIVGSSIKPGGDLFAAVEPELARALVEARNA